ncbi:MAG: biopolymer transporter ExbD [Polyangiaceae bacterium]
MGMSVSSGGNKKGVTPNMNVTPLVDVVLVLLIIFMVVTPLLTKNFWLNLPKKDNQEQTPPENDPDKPVVLTVDAQGVIKINKQVVERRELADKLQRIFAARKDQVLFFDAENDAPFGVATEAMDVARAGGARTISILTERME